MGVIDPHRVAMRGGSTLKGHARRLRGDMTAAERALWRMLRQRRLGCRFRRQVPIPPYIADFACIEARLIIEADGGQHNLSVRDEKRDANLIARGWRIMRFWNNDILQNAAGVLQTIAAALAAHPHPDPPPPAGEGDDRAGAASLPPPLAGEGRGGG